MPTKAKLLLSMGVLLAFAATVAFEEIRLSAIKDDLAKTKDDYAQYQLESQRLQRDVLIKARNETERRLTNQRKAIDDYQNTIEKLRTDYRNASAVSDRLRQQIAKLAHASRGSSTINPTTPQCGKTESTTQRIAKLAGMVDKAAGKLARNLDDAIARGKTCESLYQKLNEGNHNARTRPNN